MREPPKERFEYFIDCSFVMKINENSCEELKLSNKTFDYIESLGEEYLVASEQDFDEEKTRVYISKDLGITWECILTSEVELYYFNFKCFKKYLFIKNGEDNLFSINHGKTWEKTDLNIDEIINIIDISNDNKILATTSSIFNISSFDKMEKIILL